MWASYSLYLASWRRKVSLAVHVAHADNVLRGLAYNLLTCIPFRGGYLLGELRQENRGVAAESTHYQIP
jgi:hypothetical protein